MSAIWPVAMHDRSRMPELQSLGWGFGVAVKTEGPQRGRIGWSGGLGTDFFVDPDGTVGVLLTHVELGEDMWPLLEQFRSLHQLS